jgi:prepilin-type N-terminal cleavage/methylation domain-containing protein
MKHKEQKMDHRWHMASFPFEPTLNCKPLRMDMEACIRASPTYRPNGKLRGFTLVEILVVVLIMAILMALVSLGFQTILGTAFDSEVSDLANTLVRARAYAMANNTDVFVGLYEADASVSSSTTPQVAGNGRLGVTVVASNDGTRGFPATAPAALTATALTVVSPLRHFENVHLLTSSGIVNLPNVGSGNGGIPPTTYNVQSVNSLTTFQWPLTGSAQYSFGTPPGSVIQFNPQGEAQMMPTGTMNDSILQWIEIDIEPTHGKNVPSAARNAAAILVVGASGVTTFYRK